MRNTETNHQIKNKNHGSYGALLLDKRWKDFRKIILSRDSERCIICDVDKELQVHHKQYHFLELQKTFKKPWEYPAHLLVTVCKSCHQKGHNKYKVPIKYIKF